VDRALPLEVHVSVMNFSGVKSLLWILRDISARRELETMRDDMMAMIYHDLRSPLGNISSSLELINASMPVECAANIQAVMQVMGRSVDRLQRLVSSLLDISRLEAGQSLVDNKPFDLAELTREACELMQPVFESRGQTQSKPVDEISLPVEGDADMIRRVILNLLENAAKFSFSGSEIRVLATQKDGQAHVRVEDCGPGVPEAYRQLIFEKFTRLKHQDAPKGFGLGLAFCRLAINAHRGKIWVEPRQSGGSAFEFFIPLAE
jgi:K+-sensing histidine kinase KdpD